MCSIENWGDRGEVYGRIVVLYEKEWLCCVRL